MSLDDPVIITCAISGALADREQCPAIPYTPAEYAAEARRIVDEGGAMIHIHARRPDGTPSYVVGHVGSLAPTVDMRVLRAPLHVDCVMGVTGGIPPTACNLAAMVDNIPAGAHWGVVGVSRVQWALLAAALALGGSIRVRLEDNLYLPDGTMARSNGELVARARRMTQDAGRRPATVAEARAMLGAPRR